MRTATAYNERAGSRSAHKLAEKLAKNAGVDFDEWIGEAVAEYAEDLGVAPQDLSERERLEAIEDRIDRHARAAPAPRRVVEREPAPAPRIRRESVRAAPESEASRRARPERDSFEEDYAPAPRTAPRAAATDRLERTIQDIERRAERNEDRTAKALESLTELVASRGFEGSRLEDAVADIEKRAQRNEERTATAIESLQHLVATRGGERERLVQAVSEVETRAQRNAERTAKALESISQAVASRDDERERLEAAVERANRRNEESEARAARAFESLSAMVAKSAERRTPPAPVERARPAAIEPRRDPVAEPPRDPVAERLGQLSRRAANPVAAPRPAGDEDDEALRLVSERLARRRRQKGETPLAPPAPELADAFGDLRRDLRLLADKVDNLSDGAVGAPAVEALRMQTREVERALVMAGEKVAGAERMQTQVGRLAEQVERLASAQPASAEMAAALKALADAHARFERDDPVKALKAVERQLDDLGARVEAAARRPAQDSRAMDDLSRRIETLRAAVERQARPGAGEFLAALAALNDKLDAAAVSGSQSTAHLSSLAAMVARLEEEARRPAKVSLDPQPLDDLARRIEAVRAAVERQARPEAGEFLAALGALNDKLDSAAASGSQSVAQLSSLAAMVARLEDEARRPALVSLDAKPIEDLAHRIEAVRAAVERQARPEAGEFLAALAALNDKLDSTAASGSQSAAHLSSLAAMVARLEEEARRPTAVSLDPKPLDDLARRIEAVRVAVERQARPEAGEFLAALAALNDRLDSAAASGSQSAAHLSALTGVVTRLEAEVRRPTSVSLDPRPLEDLARRIDGLQGRLAPKVDDLQSALDSLARKLDRPTSAPVEAARFEEALADIHARLDRPAAPADTARLEAAFADIRARLDRPLTAPAEVARLEAGLAVVRARLDRPTIAPVEAARFEEALADIHARLDRPTPAPAEAARLEAALADIRARLDRPTTSPAEATRLQEQLADIRARLDRPAFVPQMEAVEAALRRMAAKVEETATRPAPALFDSQPLEDLMRRLDGSHGRLGPKVDDIHAAMGELSAKFERPARTAAEIGRIEDALRRLGAQVETALARPGAFDPSALEALARRIDAVRGAAEANGALAPQVARLEHGLAEIRARLDQPAFVPQIEAVDATLRRLAAKFEEAAARPTTVSLDARPIEDLARRIESVRASLESSPSLAPQVERLETALGVVSDKLDRDKLDRAAAPVDAQGINATLAQMNRRLEEAFRRPPEFEREHIDALAAQVEAVRETVERQAQHFDGAEAALREAVERIERPVAAAPEMVVLINAVKALATKIERVSGFDQARFEMLFGEWTDRLARQTGAPVAVRPLADAIAALGDKIEGMRPGEEPALRLSIGDLIDRLDEMAGRDSRLEGALRDVGERLSGVEHRLAAPSTNAEGWAPIEFAVRDLTQKVADLRAASDTRAVEQDVRALHEKIDDLTEISLIARPAPTAPAPASHDALIEPLLDIQERLDKLASQRATPPALDAALAEFADQMDALRAAREEASRDAATVADLRADHATFDRRMDARFSGVQDVLERLVDRIARLEREPAPEARAPEARMPITAPPSFATRPAMPDIPDRETPLRAPTPAPAPETPVLVPPPRLVQEPTAVKAAALNAHIAAARRKVSAAVENEERATAAAAAAAPSFGRRAQNLLSMNSRPVLLGAAGALTLLTGIAAYELRGHAPVHKSEIEAPLTPPTTLGEASSVDDAPLGAIGSPPKVIAAPLPAPAPALAVPAKAQPPQALLAGVPASVGPALVAAAASGDLGAEVEIAQRYLEGRTVARDPKVAADWLQTAADAGSPFASYRLGALYEKGVGVARDAARARTLYTKAADAGNARAMHNLAVLYAQDGGQGKPDYPAALDWFRRAGAYGVRDSQFNLGVLYGRGLGATQDLAQSWLWFSLAAKQGDTDAAHKRDEVAIRMDGHVMGAAKKLLDDFKIKTPDPTVNDAPPVPPAAADAAPAKKDAKAPV